MYMYLYGEGEVRRVTDVVWSTVPHPAKYQVITQCAETVSVDDLTKAEQESVSYLTNAELHQLTRVSLTSKSLVSAKVN